jgi:dTDP-4-amino-4,6-dideoxygalactose transaminase
VGVNKGDEVALQAFTCNSVPNPIVWTGAKPLYIDIEPDSLNIDPADLRKKLTNKTKVIILQHTFGRPGPIEEVLDLAREKKIYVLEDCAHSLGATHKGKKLGTFGDGAILSFNREKSISALAGGAVLVRNEAVEKPLATFLSHLSSPPVARTLREIGNFLGWRLVLQRIYFAKTGQKVIKRLNQADFFNTFFSKKELAGEKPDWYPASYPDIFAGLALEEFRKLPKYNQTRRQIALYYLENIKNPDFRLLPDHHGVYLRVPIFHPKAQEVRQEARKSRIALGNWYDTPV